MGFLVKLDPENVYIITDQDGDLVTTECRKTALEHGRFEEEWVAKENLQRYLNGLTLTHVQRSIIEAV